MSKKIMLGIMVVILLVGAENLADKEQVKKLVADMWRECSKGAG